MTKRQEARGDPGRRTSGMTFVGIDLAGSEKRQTGFCRLKGRRAETAVIYDDDQLLSRMARYRPTLVGMDAPLFLPAGRCCLRNDCTCPRDVHFRQCDLELRRRRIKFFPITLGPMRQLTMRGIRLAKQLEEMGHVMLETYPVMLETYPGAAQDICSPAEESARLEAGSREDGPHLPSGYHPARAGCDNLCPPGAAAPQGTDRTHRKGR